MKVHQQLSPNVSNKKFHSIFGKFLKVALDSAFDPSVNVEDIKILSLSEQEEAVLVHNGKNYKKISQLAKVEGDLTKDKTTKIVFYPWVKTEEVQFYCLNFHLNQFRVIFARFGEEESFSNNYINLDYFSLTQEIGFIPLFIKIGGRDDVVYLRLTSQTMGTLEISHVQESEVPLHLRE